MKQFLTLIFFLAAIRLSAQNTKPCSAPQAAQFDFWIGDWDLTWQDTLHGTNHIEKLFGNCTVHENFNGSGNYLGQSWSVYKPSTNQWQQTWVDNQGGYIALTGSWDGKQMVLNTGETQTPKGKQSFRMVYYNIQPNSFDWRWESTSDEGKTWNPNWQIHYERK
jgi:hypothetical protein